MRVLTAAPCKQDLLLARWARPSLSVVDVRSTEYADPLSGGGPAGPQPVVTGVPGGLGPAGYPLAAGCAHSDDCSAHGKRGGGVRIVLSSGRPAVSTSAAARRAAGLDRACYKFGPTRFSVIPHRAVGKISIR